MGPEHQAGQRDTQNRTDRGGSPTEQQIVPAQGRPLQSSPRLDDHHRSGLTVQGVLALQRTVGNAATGRWLRAVAAGGAVSPGGAASRVAIDPFPPQIMAPADASGRVARSPARLAQRYTSTSGLAADAAMTAFARRAFEFWKNHKEAPLEKLCEHLLEGVKNRLGELPGPPPTPTLAFKQGMGFFAFHHKA